MSYLQPKVETAHRKETSPVPMETDKSCSQKKIRVATSDGRQVCTCIIISFERFQSLKNGYIKISLYIQTKTQWIVRNI